MAVPSLPARGAWIEIIAAEEEMANEYGRSPHGERGLKLLPRAYQLIDEVVAPRTGSVD